MRIMSLDFGSKTVGVAVCDPFMIVVKPLETIRREKPGKHRRTLSRISELAKGYGVEKFVVGLPLNMDGTEGERCALSREFAAEVEKRTGIPVEMHPETLTTVEAYEMMQDAGVSYEAQKKNVDAEAAVIILEDYIRDKKLREQSKG